MEIMKLFFTKDEDLYDKTINDVFDEEFFKSNFWLYWRTMFAFEQWHSALEMKLYIQRFIHHIGGLPDFSALKFTKYNQYESLILPMIKYLEAHHVNFQYDTKVTNVIFDITKDKKVAKQIVCIHGGKEETIDLIEDDLVFVTNGSCTETVSYTHLDVYKRQGLQGAGEWSELQKLLPDFEGKSVLDLGCGYGWHCLYAANHGAKLVHGIDISEKMLDVAREKNSTAVITYEQKAMEDLDFPDSSFDVVLSSLAFHYVKDFTTLVEHILSLIHILCRH